MKLVEYGSLTCPHCARVRRAGRPTLSDNYVKSGPGQLGIPHLSAAPARLPASLIAALQRREELLPLSERSTPTSAIWVGKLQAVPQEQLEQIAEPAAEPAVRRSWPSSPGCRLGRRRGVPAGARATMPDATRTRSTSWSSCRATRPRGSGFHGHADLRHQRQDARRTRQRWAKLEPQLRRGAEVRKAARSSLAAACAAPLSAASAGAAAAAQAAPARDWTRTVVRRPRAASGWAIRRRG